MSHYCLAFLHRAHCWQAGMGHAVLCVVIYQYGNATYSSMRVEGRQNKEKRYDFVVTRDCVVLLQRMENMLTGFQIHLGSISSEIQTLQRQSMEMNVKLKNRQAVRGELSQFVDEMVVPEAMIK